MISKRVEILEILYPKGIKPEQYNKLHKIFGSIDHLIEETKEDYYPKPKTLGEAMKEAEEQESSKPSLETTLIHKTKPIDYYPVFVESNLKESPNFTKAQRVDYEGVIVEKQNLFYKASIKGEGTITAHLDYLKEYYDKLPLTITRTMFEGLSRGKQRVLFNFYQYDPKFKNELIIEKGKKVLVKK